MFLGLELADADSVLGLGLLHADGQTGCRAENRVGESAPAEFRGARPTRAARFHLAHTSPHTPARNLGTPTIHYQRLHFERWRVFLIRNLGSTTPLIRPSANPTKLDADDVGSEEKQRRRGSSRNGVCFFTSLADEPDSTIRATSDPEPLSQAILLHFLAWTRCHTVEPGEHFGDCDRVFFLGRLHADRQSRGRPERHFRENTPAKSRHRLYGSFVETLGRNSNGVLDAFRIGE
jgi:hypothetical protein